MNDIIIISIGEDEDTLEVRKGEFTLCILRNNFRYITLSTNSDKKYQLVGKSNSTINLNEQELDYVYSEHKRFNN